MDQPFPDAISAPFEPLARRVQAEATVVDDRILKIDHFLNHRIEPAFMAELGRALADRLAPFQPDLVLTAEASGIAPGLAVASALDLPLVFAKKYAPVVELPAYSRVVPSATKGAEYRLVVASRFLVAGQRIALVDDFLANGRTALALAEIVAEAGAQLVVAGFLVEKLFQNGRAGLAARGVPIATLVQVERLSAGRVIIAGLDQAAPHNTPL
ncbi:MAG TPA: xanthine phosphoribosyltransferase [Roseiflexaceae bacterium]|nr:xanthine phosphoribosyltransferase [Roseiflexaceae bacterium]